MGHIGNVTGSGPEAEERVDAEELLRDRLGGDLITVSESMVEGRQGPRHSGRYRAAYRCKGGPCVHPAFQREMREDKVLSRTRRQTPLQARADTGGHKVLPYTNGLSIAWSSFS